MADKVYVEMSDEEFINYHNWKKLNEENKSIDDLAAEKVDKILKEKSLEELFSLILKKAKDENKLTPRIHPRSRLNPYNRSFFGGPDMMEVSGINTIETDKCIISIEEKIINPR